MERVTHLQGAFYFYVALITCLYNHDKASNVRSPTLRVLRYYKYYFLFSFSFAIFKNKNMHIYAGLIKY